MRSPAFGYGSRCASWGTKVPSAREGARRVHSRARVCAFAFVRSAYSNAERARSVDSERTWKREAPIAARRPHAVAPVGVHGSRWSEGDVDIACHGIALGVDARHPRVAQRAPLPRAGCCHEWGRTREGRRGERGHGRGRLRRRCAWLRKKWLACSTGRCDAAFRRHERTDANAKRTAWAA